MEIFATRSTAAFSKAYPGIWKGLETDKAQIRGGKTHPQMSSGMLNMFGVLVLV
jgi:hypothetical protein